MTAEDRFPDNIRRLVLFHHRSAKEAGEFLGVTQHAISAWVTGKRRPSTNFLLLVASRYDFDVRTLISGDDVAFAAELARPDRIRWTEAEIALELKQRADDAVTEADLAHRATRNDLASVIEGTKAVPPDWDSAEESS